MRAFLLALFLAVLPFAARCSAHEVVIPRQQITELVLKSNVITVMEVTFLEKETKLEVVEVLFTRKAGVQKGAIISVARQQPSDGAHPSFRSLVFFDEYPPKSAAFPGYILNDERVVGSDITIAEIKKLIKSRANQAAQSTTTSVTPPAGQEARQP